VSPHLEDLVTAAPLTTRPSEHRYALDPAWHAERERLGSLTWLYDPTTLRLAEDLGLAPGWRCADVGAGTGSVAESLARAVGPQGAVLAVDTDTRFLEPLADATLAVQARDITRRPLPPGQFDLVHARLLLEHLPPRDDVLARLAAAAAPGGWLLVEDFDWSTAGLVDPPSETHARVVAACQALFTRHAYDPEYGRRLPRRLSAAGLVDVGSRAEAVQVRADAERGLPQWDLLVDQLAPGLLALGLVGADDLERFHALMRDGDTVCFAPLMVSAYGRRP
jgi:SAM-dependent methyltransferase